jgi:predicted nuclease of predicted toxin-antitoxin system
MPVGIYTDVHISKAIITALRSREVNVLTAVEDGTRAFRDADLLNRATVLKRLLYTQDDDLVREAIRTIREGIPFSGVIYSHQLRSPIASCVDDLELIAGILEPGDLNSILEYIPN